MAGSPLEMMNCETASDVRPILSTASTDYEMSIAEVVSQEEDSDPIDQQQMPISTLVQAVSMRSSMHSSRHWQSIDLTNRKESVLITQSSPQQKSQSGALLPVSTRGTRRSPRKQTLYLSPRAAAAPTKILALKNQNLPMPKCGQLDHDANASYPVPISGVVPGANEPLTTPTISTGTLKSSISQPKKVEDWTPPQTLTKTLKGGDNNEPMFGIDAEKPKSPLSNMPGICEPVEGAVASITLEQLVERMAALFPAQKEEGMTTAVSILS